MTIGHHPHQKTTTTQRFERGVEVKTKFIRHILRQGEATALIFFFFSIEGERESHKEKIRFLQN